MIYNSGGIECSFIQNLLYNKYVPTLRILKNPENAYKNEAFIHDRYIYRYVKDNDSWKNVIQQDYIPGNNIPGCTRNCYIPGNLYTSTLHEALGDYLRMIRDTANVDLLPLYNCFSNRYEDDFALPIALNTDTSADSRASYTTGIYNAANKLVAIPVKFQKSYRIFCKKSVAAKVQVALYDKKDLTTFSTADATVNVSAYQTAYANYLRNTYAEISLNTDTPYIVNTRTFTASNDELAALYQSLEPNLHLFIEVPANAAEYLVIFESLPVEEGEDAGSETPEVVGIVSYSSLLQDPTSPASPYSDKLLGYLLNYFISPLNKIPQNIQRVQQKLQNFSLVETDTGEE